MADYASAIAPPSSDWPFTPLRARPRPNRWRTTTPTQTTKSATTPSATTTPPQSNASTTPKKPGRCSWPTPVRIRSDAPGLRPGLRHLAIVPGDARPDRPLARRVHPGTRHPLDHIGSPGGAWARIICRRPGARTPAYRSCLPPLLRLFGVVEGSGVTSFAFSELDPHTWNYPPGGYVWTLYDSGWPQLHFSDCRNVSRDDLYLNLQKSADQLGRHIEHVIPGT